jgi:adenosylcobinamide-GDP ribazoletransferase
MKRGGEKPLPPGGPLRAFFSALAFLTVIPVPQGWKTGRENGMFPAFPLAGLLIGGVLCAAAAGAAWLFPPAVAAVVLVGLAILLTGAIHLDGLADCADAFYGRRDRESVLRILKDPRVGTMGAAAVGLSLLLRAASFLSIPGRMLLPALPIAAMLARAAVLPAMALLPYVRGESGIIHAPAVRGWGRAALGAAAILIALVLLPVPAAAALAGLAVLWRLSWKKIGGCTGDVLGATIEIGEVLFFIALAATEKAGLTWGLVYPLLSRR